MNVFGIGTEIIECVRIAKMIERHGELFLERVYTPEEVERWRDAVGMIMYDIVREGRVLYSHPDAVNRAAAIPAPPSARVPESRRPSGNRTSLEVS
jgi:hypothetical protein